MKKFIAIALAAALLAGCTSSTPHGKCVGINGQKDPKKVYEYSALNIFLGILFVETVIVPLFVALDQLECPVADRQEPESSR